MDFDVLVNNGWKIKLNKITGESITQRDKLISQLLELNQRFTILVSEYQVLLQMMIHFFKNVAEVNHSNAFPIQP